MPFPGDLPKALESIAARAEAALFGTVQQVGTSPRIWSGHVAVFQPVSWRVDRWLKGAPALPCDVISVLHPVVSGARTAHRSEPCLSEDFFRKGTAMALFLQLREDAWICSDENVGAVPLSPEVESLVTRILAAVAAP